jgi:hypothetical protein
MRRALLIASLLLALTASQASAQITVRCFAPTQAACSGIWHRSPVSIRWTIEPPFVSASGCINENLRQDTTAMTRGCSVINPENQDSASRGVTLKIDMTPPVGVRGSARSPDANGWYRSPLQIAFTGEDATSGLLGCTSATYAGPDGAATVSGTCTDNAGNVSAPSAFGLRYDATPPSIQKAAAVGGDEVVDLRWAVSGASSVEIWRSPGRGGASQTLLDTRPGGRVHDRGLRNGRRYDYRVRASDDAGNVATRVYSVVPGPRLIAPATGSSATAPPLLRWTEVRGARYYNVQLFRKGRKILSAWPERPRLQLEESWRFGGKRYRLKRGTYQWLVWPGRGPRSKNDYGALIGRRTFTVAP